MTYWLIQVNGYPFAVFADSIDEAERVAAVHLAALAGARLIAESRSLERYVIGD